VIISNSTRGISHSIDVNQEGYSFSISPTAFTFDNVEREEYLYITNPNNYSWTASSIPAWITLSNTADTSGSLSRITVTADINTGFERSFSGITITDSIGIQHTFNVAQESGYYFELLPSTGITINSAGTYQTMTVACNGYNWQIISKPSWVTTNVSTGVGTTYVRVYAGQNIGYERSGSIKVKDLDYNLEYTISVTQESGYVFSVSPTSFHFNRIGGSGTGSTSMVITNPNGYHWEINDVGTWISVSQTSGNSSATINITAQPNTGTSPREDYFEVLEQTVGNRIEISVTQDGLLTPTITSVTATVI